MKVLLTIGDKTIQVQLASFMLIIALAAGRVIKHMCDIKQHSVANETVKVPIYQYA